MPKPMALRRPPRCPASTANRVRTGVLCGRAGRLTAQNGGLRPRAAASAEGGWESGPAPRVRRACCWGCVSCCGVARCATQLCVSVTCSCCMYMSRRSHRPPRAHSCPARRAAARAVAEEAGVRGVGGGAGGGRVGGGGRQDARRGRTTRAPRCAPPGLFFTLRRTTHF
jgi:hypothetical protein